MAEMVGFVFSSTSPSLVVHLPTPASRLSMSTAGARRCAGAAEGSISRNAIASIVGLRMGGWHTTAGEIYAPANSSTFSTMRRIRASRAGV